MLVNSCPILNLHIPPATVSCAHSGRVAPGCTVCDSIRTEGRLQAVSHPPEPIYMAVYVLQLSKNGTTDPEDRSTK